MSSILSHRSFSLNFAPKMREYNKNVRVFLKQKKAKVEMRSKIRRKEKWKLVRVRLVGVILGGWKRERENWREDSFCRCLVGEMRKGKTVGLRMFSPQIREKTREKNWTQKGLFAGPKCLPLEPSNEFIFFFIFFLFFPLVFLSSFGTFCYYRHLISFHPISKPPGPN